MWRERINLWLVLFLAVLTLVLAVSLPARLLFDVAGLDERGLTARTVSGSVWSAHLSDVRVRDVAVGDVEVGLAFWPLLLGEARIELASGPVQGSLTLSPGGFGVSGLNGQLTGIAAIPPLPVAALGLEDVSVRFGEGRCIAAAGGARLTVGAAFGLSGGELAGPARCDGDAMLLALTAADGSARLDARLWANSRYRLALTVAVSDPARIAGLEAAGFRATPAGHQLVVEGNL